MGHWWLTLARSDCRSIPLRSRQGNQAVIAPGTGLGEAGLFWNGSQHQVFACEGGHADFAPQGELQIELLQFLASRYGHVSYERILSGPGLVNVYEFLRKKGCGEEPAGFAAQLNKGDPAADNFPCRSDRHQLVWQKRALDLVDLGLRRGSGQSGAEGDGHRRNLSRRRNFAKDSSGSPDRLSCALFWQKGRLRPLLESIPVQVITNDKAGLLGAARCAAAKSSYCFSWGLMSAMVEVRGLMWFIDRAAASETVGSCVIRPCKRGSYPRQPAISFKPLPRACSKSRTRWRACSNS
jgi:hypothetical protein